MYFTLEPTKFKIKTIMTIKYFLYDLCYFAMKTNFTRLWYSQEPKRMLQYFKNEEGTQTVYFEHKSRQFNNLDWLGRGQLSSGRLYSENRELTIWKRNNKLQDHVAILVGPKDKLVGERENPRARDAPGAKEATRKTQHAKL